MTIVIKAVKSYAIEFAKNWWAVNRRGYLDGGTRAADRVVDDIAPQLFETEDMRAAVAASLEHVPRAFRDKVVFRGR